jgi:hypothetical protein
VELLHDLLGTVSCSINRHSPKRRAIRGGMEKSESAQDQPDVPETPPQAPDRLAIIAKLAWAGC